MRPCGIPVSRAALPAVVMLFSIGLRLGSAPFRCFEVPLLLRLEVVRERGSVGQAVLLGALCYELRQG